MKAITVYKCEHCQKLFRTPDKHNCKRKPEHKNCFSCKHLDHFDDDNHRGNWGDAGYRDCNPVCGHSEQYEKETEDIIDLMYNNDPKWSLNCSGWESKSEKKEGT